MRVISNRALKRFSQRHGHAEKPLQDWRRTIEKKQFGSFADLKRAFGSVDKVGEYYVFDIAGNNYRVIAAVHFNTQTLYVRDILTHTEYDHWRP